MDYGLVVAVLTAMAPVTLAFYAPAGTELPRLIARPAGSAPGTEWLQQDNGDYDNGFQSGNGKVYNNYNNVRSNMKSFPRGFNDAPPASPMLRQGHLYSPPGRRPPYNEGARGNQNAFNNPEFSQQGNGFPPQPRMQNSYLVSNLDSNNYARPQQSRAPFFPPTQRDHIGGVGGSMRHGAYSRPPVGKFHANEPTFPANGDFPRRRPGVNEFMQPQQRHQQQQQFNRQRQYQQRQYQQRQHQQRPGVWRLDARAQRGVRNTNRRLVSRKAPGTEWLNEHSLPGDGAYPEQHDQGGGGWGNRGGYYERGNLPAKAPFRSPGGRSFPQLEPNGYPMVPRGPGGPQQQQQQQQQRGLPYPPGRGMPNQKMQPPGYYNARPGVPSPPGYEWLHNDADNSFGGREPSWTQPEKFF